MATEWPLARIDEIAQKVAMGPFGSNIKVETFVADGIPVISGQHLRGTRLLDGDYHFVSAEHADRLASSNVRRGDVVFTHAGNIGQAAYIPESSRYERYVISQRQFYLRPDRRKVMPEYLAYYFNTGPGRHQLLANSSSTGVPSIAQPVSYLRRLQIPLPPLTEQHRIVSTLGAFDDKIEMNGRMNQTLEAIARALFKSWFVDFDPVRAKAEGQETALPPRLEDLFPSRLVPSQLGDIPVGWRVTRLSGLSHKPQYGFTASATDLPVGPRFLRITDINKRPWIDWQSVPYCAVTDSELRQYSVRVGDILIARIADPGHGVMIEDDVECVFASYLIRFRPLAVAYARYMQYWLRSSQYWALVAARRTGTTRAGLNAQVLGDFPLIEPPSDVVEAFGDKVSALRSRISLNLAETESLSVTRDSLLPKLMSGHVVSSIGTRGATWS